MFKGLVFISIWNWSFVVFCCCSFHINEILCSLFNWVVVLCLEFLLSMGSYTCVWCVLGCDCDECWLWWWMLTMMMIQPRIKTNIEQTLRLCYWWAHWGQPVQETKCYRSKEYNIVFFVRYKPNLFECMVHCNIEKPVRRHTAVVQGNFYSGRRQVPFDIHIYFVSRSVVAGLFVVVFFFYFSFFLLFILDLTSDGLCRVV